MKPFRILYLSVYFVILFFSCKKEIKVIDNPNPGVALFGNGKEHYITQVIQTNDNHYILGGTTLGGANGMYDFYAMKVDENFNIVWYKNFGGKYGEIFYSMAQDEEGNIMIAGDSHSFGSSIDTNELYVNGLFYIVYINKDGDTIWEKTFRSNPGNKNFENISKKILYLNNKTFVVMGQTSNYSGNGSDYDVYGFCIDKQANIKWTRRLYIIPIPFYTSEFCQNACLSEDGNIIFQIRNDSNYTSQMRLAKTSLNGSGHTNNSFLWKGPSFINFLVNTTAPDNQDVFTILPMASCGGDKVAMADLLTGGLIMTKEDGSLLKMVAFKNHVTIFNMRRVDERLMVIGTATKTNGSFPVIIFTTLSGDVLEEIYLNENSFSNPNINVGNVFINNKNEFVFFGSVKTKKGSNIVMMKYDHCGNLITK